MPREFSSGTPEELINYLKHSNLPTVVTEGLDDYHVFRRLEHDLSNLGVSFLPVGGKSTVLELFRNRSEFSHISVVFVVDQDLWLFEGVPADFLDDKVILTDGYSIENDLFRDGDIEQLMLPDERTRFKDEVMLMVRWICFAIGKAKGSGDKVLSLHPARVIDDAGNMLCSEICKEYNFVEADQSLRDRVSADYAKFLRGKTLFDVALRQLSNSSRKSKFSRQNLMEIGASKAGPHLQKISKSIQYAIPRYTKIA